MTVPPITMSPGPVPIPTPTLGPLGRDTSFFARQPPAMPQPMPVPTPGMNSLYGESTPAQRHTNPTVFDFPGDLADFGEGTLKTIRELTGQVLELDLPPGHLALVEDQMESLGKFSSRVALLGGAFDGLSIGAADDPFAKMVEVGTDSIAHACGVEAASLAGTVGAPEGPVVALGAASLGYGAGYLVCSFGGDVAADYLLDLREANSTVGEYIHSASESFNDFVGGVRESLGF